MAKTRGRKDNYPEIQHIKEDLDSLKTNVIELTRHLQENGSDQALELSRQARRSLDQMQARGMRQVHRVEDRVKERPSQSIAVAFAAGLLASLFFARRSRG